MKFSKLPILVFITRDGMQITLAPPSEAPHPKCFAARFVFKDGKSFCEGKPFGLNATNNGAAAHAFFASQINLEDYHASK